jgi:hypothetical protein
MDCPPVDEPQRVPQRWVGVCVWLAGSRTVDVTTIEGWSALPDDIVGAVGTRNDSTHDYLSGSDWYGWVMFDDGDWRISGITGSRDEMLRQAARYPGSVWKEGRLVSDAEMQRVSAAMRDYVQ